MEKSAAADPGPLSVEEAQKKVLEHVQLTDLERVSPAAALGRALAADLKAPEALPHWDNSAMDGYALRAAETALASVDRPLSFRVVGRRAAGEAGPIDLGEGEALRILTGAIVPPAADAVVMQEEVERRGGEILLKRPVERGDNIRRRGEEIEAGELALERGREITPAAVGFLRSLGVNEVQVHRRPRVAVISTGNELVVGEGAALQPGQIRESNSHALSAALAADGLPPVGVETVPDEPGRLLEALGRACRETDCVLVTGGVSVGDLDLVRPAGQALAVEPVFWRVRQKPGGPLFFGVQEKRLFFGLPGNPVAALVCYFEYVRPALRAAQGFAEPFLKALPARLAEPFRKFDGKTHFLRGRLETASHGEAGTFSEARLTGAQGSHIQRSFAQAEVLIVIPEACEELPAGSEVMAHLLPW